MAAYYRNILKGELERRIDANPRYSLRSFAKALRIDPTGLSRIIAGKKGIKVATAEDLAERLALAPDARRSFIDSARSDRTHRIVAGATASRRGGDPATVPAGATLSADAFRVIGDWYHCAMLALTCTQGFQPDPKWIAAALGISRMEAQLALERLVKLGLLTREKGTLRMTNKNLETGDRDRTSAAHRRHQAQMLTKAQHSLENDPLESRSMTGMTMAIDERKLPLARQLIQSFSDSLCQMLEGGEQKRVFQLTVSLFPLERTESRT